MADREQPDDHRVRVGQQAVLLVAGQDPPLAPGGDAPARPLEEFQHFTKYLTRPGDWVLDPMAGSFASGKAAKALGRNYLGVDIDPEAVAGGKQWIEEE